MAGFSARDALVILTPAIVYDAFDLAHPKRDQKRN